MMWRRNNAKYGNKRVESAGFSFASKGEAACHEMLQMRELAKEIRILQRQCQVYLSDAKILYKPDFKIEELATGKTVWVEYKGFETPEWRIKRRLWLAYGPGELQIWKGSGRRLTLFETLIPKGGCA